MNELHVFLFGKLSVAYNEDITNSFHINKVQELFSYLLIRRHPHSRDALAEMLWDNVSSQQSKNYLRKVLWQLQTSLNVYTNSAPAILQVQTDCICLNPLANYWLDVAIFENAFNRVQGISGSQLATQQVEELETAVSLYSGDLLEGWYQEWCLYERERFQQMLLIMLDKLMGHYELYGQYEAGLAHGSRILHYDPARERTHLQLMRLHYLNGDRTEALRQYERCVAILDKELEVTPSELTTALYQQIRHERPICPPTSPLTPPTSSLTTVLNHLKQFQADLTAMQCQIQQDIDIVEKQLQKPEI